MTKEKRFLLFKGAKKKPCMSSEDLTIKTKIDSLKHSKKMRASHTTKMQFIDISNIHNHD